MRRVGILVLALALASFGTLLADPKPSLQTDAPDIHAEHDHGMTPVADNVSYNTKSRKYHNSSCRYWGCSNCTTITKADAKKRGGVACKVCGG